MARPGVYPTLARCVWSLVACLALAGCQFLLEVDQKQCEEDRECVELIGSDWECGDESICVFNPQMTGGRSGGGSGTGGNEPPDAGMPPPPLPDNWQCLREPKVPIVPDPAQVVDVSFVIVDFVTLEVPEGITAIACENLDPGCVTPLGEPVMPNERGYLAFDNMPHGFDGFFVVQAPRIVTSVLFSNRPFFMNEEWEGPSVVSPETQAAIANAGGEQVETERSTAIIDVYDCDGNAAAGVVYTKKDASEEHAFYFVGSYPDRQQEATSLTMDLNASRTPRAVGGFSMVNPGYVVLVAKLSPSVSEEQEVVGEVTVQMTPGRMSFGRIYAGY